MGDATRLVQADTGLNGSFHTDRKARDVTSDPRSYISSTKDRQTTAAHLHNLHPIIRQARASEATRALPHKREALRVPTMHAMLRTTRPTASASTEIACPGRDFLASPQWAQGKHDRAATQLFSTCAQELRVEQRGRSWEHGKPKHEAAREYHQPHRPVGSERLSVITRCNAVAREQQTSRPFTPR